MYKHIKFRATFLIPDLLKNIAVFKSLQFLLVRKPDCILPSLCVELVVLAWSAAVCDPGLRSSFFFLHCSIADDLHSFSPLSSGRTLCVMHALTHTRAVCFRKLGETLGSQISSCMSGSGFTIYVFSYSNEIYFGKKQNKQEKFSWKT